MTKLYVNDEITLFDGTCLVANCSIQCLNTNPTDADLSPPFYFNADPGLLITLLRIRTYVIFTLMRIRIVGYQSEGNLRHWP
jgi:hypothetical protein